MFLLFKYDFMFWNQFYFVAMEKGLYIILAQTVLNLLWRGGKMRRWAIPVIIGIISSFVFAQESSQEVWMNRNFLMNGREVWKSEVP